MNELPAYDLSQLMSVNGELPHFVIVDFRLPYCLHLPDGNYPVTLENGIGSVRQAQVTLREVSLRVPDPTARPLGDKVERVGITGELHRYTRVIVWLPFKTTDEALQANPSRLTSIVMGQFTGYRQVALKIVNRLLSVYRHLTGQHTVMPLTGRATWFDCWFEFAFNSQPAAANTAGYTLTIRSFFDLHSVHLVPTDLPDALVAEVRQYLMSTIPLSLWDELLLNANEFLEQGNYRLAVVEAETALEAARGSMLQHYYAGKESAVRIPGYHGPDHMIGSNGFRGMMRALGKEFGKGGPRYKKWEKEVWGLRNKIVHGERARVSRDEAANAVRVVEEAVGYLLNGEPSPLS